MGNPFSWIHDMLCSTIPLNIQVFLKKHLRKGSFGFNIGAMFAGNISAQMTGLLFAPIITRLYAPEDFGFMILITSIVSVLSTIACMRYETAIVLPKKDNQALNIIASCLILTCTLSIVLLISILFLDTNIASWFHMDSARYFLYFIPIAVFVKGIEIVFRFWNIRKKNFTLLSTTKILIPLSANCIKIFAGIIIGSTALWLIIGEISGFLIIAVIFISFFFRNDYNQFTDSVNKQEMSAVVREYIKFPKYNSPTALMNELSINLPSFLLAYFFSIELVGYYALATKILKRPVQLISNSVRGVFLQRFVQFNSEGKSLRPLFLKTTGSLAAVAILPFSVLTIAGKFIFTVVFGAKWAVAGVYASFLSPWLFLMCINPPASQVILVHQKLSFYLIYQVFLILFRALSIVSGFYVFHSASMAVALFSGVGIIANITLILCAYKLTGESKITI